MESTRPMASIIGFDAATLGTAGAVNRGRRSTDPGNQRVAELFDLATFADTGDRAAARIELPAPEEAPVSSVLTVLDPADRAAADRLYVNLTTGGSWLRVTDDRPGTVVMRLHDGDGTPVRELAITDLRGGGPEVA